MAPVLHLCGFRYTYPGAPGPALEGASLHLDAGECVCVTGPSGSGKTTLLLAIQGLLKTGQARGTIRLGNGEPWARAGMVFQNAESQILCTTVEDEVAFGPQNLGLPAHEIRRRIRAALDAVGLVGLERRNVEQLSAGEKHRLAIASVLSMAPRLLLLDEPTSQLDIPGKERLFEVLRGLKDRGHALLIADHDLRTFRTIADRVLVMENGALREGPDMCGHWDCTALSHYRNQGEPEVHPPGALAIRVEDLKLPGPNGRAILDGVNMRVFQGELVHLLGHNGAGKSTLLRCMVGLLIPESGAIEMAGIGHPKPERIFGRVGFLFQNPVRQLFEDTVWAEVGYSLRRLGLPSREIHERVREALDICEASQLGDRPPLALSHGEQHRVALASVIASRPEVLLLDEPFAGLDFQQRLRVLHMLYRLRQRHGTTVLIASHDPLPDARWADRSLTLQGGRIAAP